jgi:predicted Zn-dependent protease
MRQRIRSHLIPTLLGCAASLLAVTADARVSPSELEAAVGMNYEPTDKDEIGLWQQCVELERYFEHSNQLMRSQVLNDYVRGIMVRLLGEQSQDLRLYLVHDPSFNASMAPNGMVIVHSGLLARVRSESQLAAVIAHEMGHYLLRHSLYNFRNVRAKASAMAFVSVGAAAGAGFAAGYATSVQTWIDAARLINQSLLLALFRYSRQQEREADAFSIKLLDAAGYPPSAASDVWQQIIAERQESAAARGKKYRDRADSAFSTHPPSAERMVDLAASAREVANAPNERQYEAGRETWKHTIGPYRTMLLQEQVQLNDPGASLYLIRSLAADGWDGMLRYFEGEVYRLRNGEGDQALASEAYATAVTFPDAPPEAWRQHGYALDRLDRTDAAKAAMRAYLALKPDASDAAMIEYLLNE